LCKEKRFVLRKRKDNTCLLTNFLEEKFFEYDIQKKGQIPLKIFFSPSFFSSLPAEFKHIIKRGKENKSDTLSSGERRA